MEYKKDLLQKDAIQKHPWLLRTGVFGFYVLAGWQIYLLVSGKMDAIYWINSIAYLLFALIWTLVSFGYNPEKLFGKAYLHINTEVIDIKTSLWEQRQMVKWKDIWYITYKPGKYHITTTHGQTTILSFSKLEYQMLMEVKEAIRRNAEWHGLKVLG